MAQLAAHLSCKQVVGGSSPPVSSKIVVVQRKTATAYLEAVLEDSPDDPKVIVAALGAIASS